MLLPLKNILESTKDWIFMSFYISKVFRGVKRPQRKKKAKDQTSLESSPLNSFVKPEIFWDGMGWLLTANSFCLWIWVSYVFFSSSLISEVAERWAAANKISPRVTSDMQTMDCQYPLQKAPIPGSVLPQQWPKQGIQ